MSDVSVPEWCVSDGLGLGLVLGHSLTHSLTHSLVPLCMNISNQVSTCSFSFEYSNTVLYIEQSTVVMP